MSLSVLGLSSLASDSTLASAAVVAHGEHNTHRTNYRGLINNLLTVAQEQQNHRSSASEPADTPDGAIWYDSGNAQFKLRRSSAWTVLLEQASAYTVDFATAGTDTFRMGGPFHKDTTQVSRTTTGVLMTYTLPAGQLARDGQYVFVRCIGTRSGAVGAFSLQPRFGGTAIGTMASVATGLTDWWMEFLIVRTGAATQDAGYMCVLNSDAAACTTLVEFSSALGQTLSGALAIDVNLSAIAAGTVTQEIMVVEFGNY